MMQNSAFYCMMQLFHCNNIIWQHWISMNFTVQILNGYKNTACFWWWFAAHYIWYHTRILSFNNIYYHLLSKMRHSYATFYGTVYHNGIVPYNAIWCHISLFILHCNGITGGYYVSINFTMFFRMLFALLFFFFFFLAYLI